MSDRDVAAALRFEDGVRAVRKALDKSDFEGAWRAVDAYTLSGIEIADLGLPPRPASVPAPRRQSTCRQHRRQWGIGAN